MNNQSHSTWQFIFEWIEKCDDAIDENDTIEQDIAPQRHVAADPEQCRLAAQFLLPFHFIEHFFCAIKEVCDFAALVVTFRRVEYFGFRVVR